MTLYPRPALRAALAAAPLSAALLFAAPAEARADTDTPSRAPDKALAETVVPLSLDATVEAPAAGGPFAVAVRDLLERGLAADAGARRAQDLAALHGLYRDRGFRPLWSGAHGATAPAEAAVGALANAGNHGLDPEDYGASAVAALMGATRPDLRAEFEVRLSLGLMVYAGDLSEGRTVPGQVFAENHIAPEPLARIPLLRALVAAPDAAALERRLGALAPPLPEYARLRAALEDLRRAEALETAWPRVDPAPAGGDRVIEPGQANPRVAQVRARLLATGELSPAEDRARDDPEGLTRFDPALEAALRDFQARHGLLVDGRIGPNTIAAMNVPRAARIRQIMLNLERLRWMPDRLGESHLLVNLADFSVTGVFAEESGGERLYRSRAVVGDPYNRTPVFSDAVEYLEFNPYWNVPHSIATEEILPKVKADPGYLAANDYEILTSWGSDATVVDPAALDWSQITAETFGFRIRQKPGPGNALGRVKFMFPNRFNVYLHDTPARRLFARPARAFSHGCVRLDKPLELAEILLRDDPAWTPERIRRVIASGERTIVSLPQPVPIHLTYLTAWVDDAGGLQFRQDVYGRDEALAAALLEPRAHLN